MSLGTLIEKIIDPSVRNINPHEVARELTVLSKTKNYAGVLAIQGALRGVSQDFETADSNLYDSAVLADRVTASGGVESSGQLLVPGQEHEQFGSIASFFIEATKYSTR